MIKGGEGMTLSLGACIEVPPGIVSASELCMSLSAGDAAQT